tara:strand:- start:159 stop:413 length:255 start_codon:yes stop_codon:yes gene_type:complete
LLLVVLLLDRLDLILVLLLLQVLPTPQQELLEFLQDILLEHWKSFKFIVRADVVADHACMVLAVADVHGHKDLLTVLLSCFEII